MLTVEALRALKEDKITADLCERACDAATNDAAPGILIAPEGYSILDLEQYLPAPRRMRGQMSTSHLPSFSGYVLANAGIGTKVFVDQANMQAVAVLDLGTAADPQHGQHRATFSAKRTPEHEALRVLTGEQGLTQRALVEWMEEWAKPLAISGFDDGDAAAIGPSGLIHAARRVTIEAVKKTTSDVGNFSASRSAMEEVAAKSADSAKLPGLLGATLQFYDGIGTPKFIELRLSAIVSSDGRGGDNLRFKVAILARGLLDRTLAEEACAAVRDSLSTVPSVVGDTIEVLIGGWAK